MLVGAKQYNALHTRAVDLLRENKLHAASELDRRAWRYHRRGIMARAYVVHFCAWLEMRIRRNSYNGELIDVPYDVWTAPRDETQVSS